MKPSIIKFSHEYTKMPLGWRNSVLLEVLETHTTDLSEEFIKYDTHIRGQNEYFKLPNDFILVLLLRSLEGHLWTTIRRCTTEKRAYYKLMRGMEFKCKFSWEP